MRDIPNISEVVRLSPEYIGFILYPHSPRFIDADFVGRLKSQIPRTIKKVGVIVDEPLEKAMKLAMSGSFDLLQLHGNENAGYCRKLSAVAGIIKAFRIDGKIPPDLVDYEPYCRLFLFDSAGKNPGGNGKKFDHRALRDYNLKTKFIVGGGISAEDFSLIRNIRNDSFSGVDLNSRFEVSPGIKDISKLKIFIEKIRGFL